MVARVQTCLDTERSACPQAAAFLSQRTRITLSTYVYTSFVSDLILAKSVAVGKRFLLGTGRMPHPVGGVMGVISYHCCEKGIPRFDILLNIHKTTSRWYCMAVVLRPQLLTFACWAWHPANCSTALPKVFSSDYRSPMHQNSYVGVKPGRSPCGLHKLWPTLVHVHLYHDAWVDKRYRHSIYLPTP